MRPELTLRRRNKAVHQDVLACAGKDRPSISRWYGLVFLFRFGQPVRKIRYLLLQVVDTPLNTPPLVLIILMKPDVQRAHKCMDARILDGH